MVWPIIFQSRISDNSGPGPPTIFVPKPKIDQSFLRLIKSFSIGQIVRQLTLAWACQRENCLIQEKTLQQADARL
jgi:hypothetical protein